MLFNNQHKFTHRYINNVVNKPLLHKKGKQWIVISALSLALAGGFGLVTSSLTTHADTTNNANQPTNIMKTASAVHTDLLTNAATSTKPSSANQNKQNSKASNTTSSKATSTSSSKASSASSTSVKSASVSNSTSSKSVNSNDSKSTSSKNSKSDNTSKPTLGLTLSTFNMTKTSQQSQSTNKGNSNTTKKAGNLQAQQSPTNPSQQLSDINPAYRQFPFQPQGQDQVDQMNFVYLLNGKPMNANEVPDITHTRTKNSDYSLSKYDENNPYKLYDGTKLYGYDILAHGGTPFSNDFSRYMPKYFNGYKLKKPVFPLNTPQVDVWNSKKIGTDFKGAGTNGITYYLDYTPAKNTIWYHIDNRPSVTALSDVSNGNNGNMTSDYDHNLSDFVNNAKNGKWANLPYSDVKVGYSDGQPKYEELQDVVVKTDTNHRGYSDFFKKVGNNYKYGQSDLESYVPRQFTIDAEPMASITIHFLYNGKDVTTPIVKTGAEHTPFDISDYEDKLPQGYNYIHSYEKASDSNKIYSPIDTSTLSDANPEYFDKPCDTTAFGTVMQGAGQNAGQYSNNKDVDVILTKDNTDTVSYSYNGKILPNGWSKSGSVGNRDNSLASLGSKLGRMASDSDHTMSNDYNYLASNYKYPKGDGFTISLDTLGEFSRLLGTTGHSDYGDTHAIIPLQKAQDTIKYIDMDNGKQIGSTWVNKLSSDMSSDNDSQLHQFRSDILNIASDLNSDATYSDLHNNYNLLSDYTIVKNDMFNKAQNALASNSTVSLGVRSFPYGRFNLVIPVQTENPASNYIQYVDANNPSNIISSNTLNGPLGQSDSDVNTDYINKHLPSDYQITQMPNLSGIKYDNSAITVPITQKTTHINIKYVDLDNIYNPYGKNDPNAKYVDYYKELGSDKLVNNLQKPNIPFNVLNYNNTNFESSDAIKDIAHVDNYQYSQMVSDNNVYQFSDKPQTIIIGLQKVGDNGITYDVNGDPKQPIASWTSPKKGTMNKDNPDIVNLHNSITPYNAPNLPSGYVIPATSDGNGNSDYTKFTSDDNPLEPNNVNYYHYGQHYNIPVVKAQHTITVNFVNDSNNQFIQKAGSDTEKAGTPFDVTKYTHKLPSSDYYYVGVRNNRKDFGTKDYTVDVLLKKYQGTINVNWIDETNGNNVIKAFPSTTEDVETPFSSGSYLQNLPSEYRFDKMTGDVSKYTKGNHTINIYLRQKSNITVNYVDALTNNIIQKAGSNTNIVGTPFNITPYESSNVLPKGYVFDRVDNNTDHFDANNQTVNILLRKLSTVGIHYVNAQTGSDVEDTLPSINVSGTAINLTQYQNNVPSGYQYVKTQIPTSDGTFNGTAFDNNNHIITILLHREQGTIQVNYIDKANGKTVESVPSITGYASTPFDSTKYTQSLPSGYGYAGIKNNVTQFNNGNQVVNIYLNKIGTIKVQYEDIKSQPQQILSTTSKTEPVNTPFDISPYLDNLPTGYNYVGINSENSQNSNNFDGTSFISGTNTITILVNKEPTPKVAKSTITVDYVDSANPSHIISQAGKKTANVSTPFDISEYMDKVPNGYEYAGIKNADSNDNFNGTEFDYNNHTIDILLRRVHPASKHSSAITINYVDNGKVITSSKDTEPVSTNYDIYSHLNIPKGYEYTGMTGDVDHFDYNNHTITVLVNKITPAKVAKSTITVNYVDKNGKLIQKAGSDTEDITTPFDIGNYLSNLPSDYEYAGIRNNVDSFDYNNHTIDILLNKVVPKSSASSNSGSNSAKTDSSTASNNSSSAKSSTSGGQTKHSSTSNQPSNSSAKSNSGSSAKSSSASKAPSSTSNPVQPSSSATPNSAPSSTSPQASSSSASVPSAPSSASASTPSSVPANSNSSAKPNKSSKHKKLGMIVVQYVGPHHKVISTIKPMVKMIGTRFNSNPYIHMIPKGYRYAGIKHNTSSFNTAFHKISILVKKLTVKPVPNNEKKPMKPSKHNKSTGNSSAHKPVKPNHTIMPNKHSVIPNINRHTSIGNRTSITPSAKRMIAKNNQKRSHAQKLPQTSEDNMSALIVTLAVIMLGNAFLLSLLDRKHYLD